jgi:hypothetical protein
MMNLAIRGIEADLGEEQADTFRRDLHPDLRADFVLANPPFNDSDWFRKDDDARWQFGLPPRGNANFAWVQHFIHHLAPTGMAGFVLANGSMSANQSGDGRTALRAALNLLISGVDVCHSIDPDLLKQTARRLRDTTDPGCLGTAMSLSRRLANAQFADAAGTEESAQEFESALRESRIKLLQSMFAESVQHATKGSSASDPESEASVSANETPPLEEEKVGDTG